MTGAVPLVERLARRLYANQAAQGEHFATEGPWWDDARALLPVVEQVVTEARGEALREAADDFPHGVLAADPTAPTWLRRRADAIATTEAKP